MKIKIPALLALASATGAQAADLTLSGVIDGPLLGGTPKAIELFVINDIPDLSVCGVGSANNGGGTDGEEFSFPAMPVTAGSYLYLTTDAAQFSAFFGFTPDNLFVNGTAPNINGDDAVELFCDGAVVDVFGDINTDGTGQAWDHVDGWAYRNNQTGPDGSAFVLENWQFSGPDALDGELTNDTAAVPFPIGSFTTEDNGDGDGGDPTVYSVVITEIMQNPSAVSDSAGEWFEVLNTGAEDVNLNGWTVSDNDSDSFVITGDLIVPAGAYRVLANNGDSATNGGFVADYVFSGMALANGADELVLTAGNGTEVDRAEWDGGTFWPDPNGASMTLIDAALDNNDGSNWTTATVPYGDGDLGTPGSQFGKPNLLITEIMQNPSAVSDGSGEWFEIYNAGSGDVNLNGFTVQDNDSDSFLIEADVIVPAGGFVVLGNNADEATNGGVTVAYEYGSQMFLSNGADEVVLLTDSGEEVDRVEYDGGPVWPDPTGASMELTDLGLDNSLGENWATATMPFGAGDLGTPGTGPDGDDGPGDADLGVCFDPATEGLTLISAVQGNGTASPIVGQSVIIEGVITGLRDNGFFIQEEVSDEDSDPATSEGVFVYASDTVTLGNVYRVGGEVVEYFDLTELTNVTGVLNCDVASSASTAAVTLPLPENQSLEHFEGMLVSIDNLVVTTTNDMWRRGEIGLSTGLKIQPTERYAPLTEGYNALVEENARDIIFVEDNSGASFPPALSFYPGFSYANAIRIGDTVSATGPLNYTFGNYKVNPLGDLIVNNTRPSLPVLAEGNLKVATFNVLNYFNGTDDGNGGTTFDYPQNRGATNAEQFALQQARIVEAIVAIDADVLGLMEIENDGFAADSAIQSLVDAVNAELAEDQHYLFVAPADNSLIGSDAIAVGLMYRPGVVVPAGDAVKVDMPEQLQANNSSYQRMRTSLLQSFTHLETGEAFAVVVNHFKSKGSGCYEDEIATTDIDAIQGSCNALRVSAAVTLGEALKAESVPDRVMILGDLNAYSAEDPLAVLTGYDPAERGYAVRTAVRTGLNGGESVEVLETYGYVNLAEEFDPDGFSYWFNGSGQVGSLDHVLANPALTEEVVDAKHWSINAYEAYQLQYDQALRFYPDASGYMFTDIGPYRSSDHDPFIVSLMLVKPPVPGDLDGDEDVDNDDMKILLAAIRNGEELPIEWDFNGDGVVDYKDIRGLRALCTRRGCRP